ncbi:neuroligin-4, X-linked-like [Saccoglossus kowalevskii]|uniref:Carboxylic ester hydrolase n=1 Tax=Saccoglossus kowalevskii TaxID=10224 RepID=A0ABM0H134_SACKO|nr:PREDICTED: neuroligin-4, X-linked-like [Saccoglossus kowalevskii]
MSSIVFSIPLVLLVISTCNADRPSVEISTGTLIGTVEEFSSEFVDGTRTVHAYRGIPYAEPPVGDLRFAPPKPKTPWQGEYDASDFRTACIQPDNPMIPVDKIQDEDCLHVSVYVPQPSNDKKSVMVWIHGGGLTYGSGTMLHDGTVLSALNDVIIVTINYRLGVFGFFSTGDDVASGNYGFLDQVEALRWVQQNIAAFGGDPDNVTIFGQSAGSISCHAHMLSEMSKGLFNRAILQSGTAIIKGFFNTDPVKSKRVAAGLGHVVGCEKDNTVDLLKCLRSLPAEEFLDADDPSKGIIANVTGMDDLMLPFLPNVDGIFLKEDPMVTAKSRPFNDVDLMIGTMADEGMVFIVGLFPEAEDKSDITMNKTTYDGMYPHIIPEAKNDAVLSMLELLYVDWDHADDDEANYVDAISQMAGDWMFVCPSDTVARSHVEGVRTTYLYQMTHVPTNTLWPIETWKANHGDDVSLVFGIPLFSEKQLALGGDETSMFKYPISEEDVKMSLAVMKYWTNFAKTG